MADRMPFARLWRRSTSPENELLLDFMSIANVHRTPIHNATGDIVGVNILAEVVTRDPYR